MALTAEQRQAKKRAYQREWYHNNKERLKQKADGYYVDNKERVLDKKKSRTSTNREIVNTIKNVPCTDCGGVYPPYVMDFDHIEDNKEHNVSQMMSMSLDVILNEISKCDIVCANCHRIRTHERRTNSKARSDSFECSAI